MGQKGRDSCFWLNGPVRRDIGCGKSHGDSECVFKGEVKVNFHE